MTNDVETKGPANPFLPAAPLDGKHRFNGGYRCKRCGVYDRPDVPSTKEVMDAPCEGQWAHSGKFRYAAEQQFTELKAEIIREALDQIIDWSDEKHGNSYHSGPGGGYAWDFSDADLHAWRESYPKPPTSTERVPLP